MLTRRSLLIGSLAVNVVQLAGCSRTGMAPLVSEAVAGQTRKTPVADSKDRPIAATSRLVRAPSLKGENLAGGEFWNAHDLFIDLIDNAGTTVTSEFTDPDTGVVTVPSGRSWSAALRVTNPVGTMGHFKLRPGTIRVWWSGTATTESVKVSAPEWARVSATGPQQLEVVIPAEALQTGGHFLLQCGNYTGGTVTMIEPHAVYVDDLAAFNAGEIFDPRHLASYPPDIGCIRVPHTCFVNIFDGQDQPLSRELNYGQMVKPATNHFLKHRNIQTAARLAARLGPNVALWINANALLDAGGYAQMARDIAATGFTGKLVLEVGLEFWNFAFPYGLQRIRTREVVAPRIRTVDNRGNPSTKDADVDACCYAEKSMQLWEAFAGHFPQDRLIRVLTGQSSWFDLMSAMFAYQRDGAGPRCGEIYDANSIVGYVGWTGTQEMWDAGVQNYTPAQWDAEMRKRLTDAMAEIDLYKSQAQALPWSKNPNYLMYEGWHHIAAYDTLRLGRATGAAGQRTLSFASGLSGKLSTGDFVYSAVTWNWVDAVGSPWPKQGGYARVVDDTHVTLHPSAADALANSNALPLLVSVTDAEMTSRGRAKAIADSALAWMHSPQGVAWTEAWWTQILARFNGYCCIFEPKQAIVAADGLWSFYPQASNLHDAPGLLLSWWRGARGD